MTCPTINALTVDVEDYHNVVARDWLGRESSPTEAVVRNTRRFLEMFANAGARATFFVLGEVAETFPKLIHDIAAAGHEVGVHGYAHKQVFKLTPQLFLKDVCDSRARIEDAAGARVFGHRAAAFSITPETAWALDVLAEAGFQYDSSIFPIAGRRYGWPGFPLDIHHHTTAEGRRIIEAPLSTVSVLWKRLPACGGGYLRHFPGFVTRMAMRRVQRSRPAIVYLHPYEIEHPVPPMDTAHLDPDAARRFNRFHRLQHRNRITVEPKVISLLSEFKFAPLKSVIERELEVQLTAAESNTNEATLRTMK